MTLIELMVTLVLLGLVMATLMAATWRQQRFFRGTSDMVDARTQLRQAMSTLPPDLRSISPAGGDIYTMNDSTIEYRSIHGTSLMCSSPTTTTIVLPPSALPNGNPLARGNALTTWLHAPVVGDSILIYDDSTADSTATWKVYGITAVTSLSPTTAGACGTSSGYVQVSDSVAGAVSTRLTLGVALSPTVIPGAPIHIFRRVHYGVYQANDAAWYLGYFDCLPTRTPACSTISQVRGPYVSAAQSSPVFTFYDSTGTTATTVAAQVAAIGVTLHARPQASWNIDALQQTAATDSLTTFVALRNRR